MLHASVHRSSCCSEAKALKSVQNIFAEQYDIVVKLTFDLLDVKCLCQFIILSYKPFVLNGVIIVIRIVE